MDLFNWLQQTTVLIFLKLNYLNDKQLSLKTNQLAHFAFGASTFLIPYSKSNLKLNGLNFFGYSKHLLLNKYFKF